MPGDYRARTNPEGFEHCTTEVKQMPQKEQQTTDVRVLIKADQTSTTQSTGGMNTTPGPGGL